MAETLYLVDGHGIAYRSYFALTAGGGGEQWRTSTGEPTAGTFGFASILLRILENERPSYLAVAFDTGKTFRNEMFDGYKATRAKMPEDLRPQIQRMRELVDTLNIPRLEMEGYEADDVIGSTAKQAAAQGYQVKIITGDKDLLQLVDDHIRVNLAGSKISDAKDYDPSKVHDFFGVSPIQVIDYKALVGDPSDNYPGVAGIGPKTAVSLLSEYSSLDGIYEHLDQIKGSTKTKLENNRANAYLSRDLARIMTDLPVSFYVPCASTQNLDFIATEQLFLQLEFRTLTPKLKRISGFFHKDTQPSLFDVPVEIDPIIQEEQAYTIQVDLVNNESALNDLAKVLRGAKQFAVDTETSGTNAMDCQLVGLSFAIAEGQAWYLPVGHHTEEAQLPLASIQRVIGPILADTQLLKVGHNIKFDALVLKNHGMPLNGIVFDTMVAGWVIEPTSKNLGLKAMAEALLGIHMTHIESLIGKGKKQISMAETRIQDAAPYAAADAEVVMRLIPLLEAKLKEQGTEQIFQQIEIPLIPVLIEMEYCGILLDVPFLQQLSQELAQRLDQLEQQICQQVGYSFNINSTQQLSKALFTNLALPAPERQKKTAAGFYSTAADVLEEMRDVHPVIDLILENRELTKIKSTYLDALPEAVNPKTGRVHTSFNQTGTVTGRLASSNPNLQNIPTRTEIGRKVRQAFTAASACVFLSVDYSQIELRIIAHMAKDQAMIAAFQRGEDIHAATAAAIYGVPIEDVSKEMRRHAKAINFGLIYGMSSFGLSQSANLTPSEAALFVNAYFRQFPGVKAYLDQVKEQASEDGYVETLMGRKRYFPTLHDEMNRNLRNREEREAINAPVQGTAADIMKVAMIQVPVALREAGLHSNILLQVHDELVLECPQEELEETRQVVQHVMEAVCTLSVPIVTDAESGENWGAL